MVHKIRNSLKYVSHKHDKAVAAGLKLVYRASTKAAARAKLERFAQT
ncbi:transposase [Alicyclobacillus pomorum]